MTTTYATLPVSKECYNEIRALLEQAQYNHVFMRNGGIDMTGIAIINREEEVLEC